MFTPAATRTRPSASVIHRPAWPIGAAGRTTAEVPAADAAGAVTTAPEAEAATQATASAATARPRLLASRRMGGCSHFSRGTFLSRYGTLTQARSIRLAQCSPIIMAG